jgi:DNA-binding LacI/PurR family transcriptional regulator
MQGTLRQLAFSRFPHVALESHLDEKGVHTVMGDDEQAAYECTQTLLKLGHRRIGFIGSTLKPPELNSGNRRRLRGYQQALAEAGISINAQWIATVPNNPRDTPSVDYLSLAQQLLRAIPRPTAIVCALFGAASAVWQVSSSKGIRIPEQLSLICVDVHPGNETQWQINDKRFNLSGFMKPMHKVGRVAVDRLLDWVRNRQDFMPCLVKVPFVKKEGATIAECGITRKPKPFIKEIIKN